MYICVTNAREFFTRVTYTKWEKYGSTQLCPSQYITVRCEVICDHGVFLQFRYGFIVKRLSTFIYESE